MKLTTTLIFLFIAALSVPVWADHDNWRRGYSSHHQSARHYAERAVQLSRRAREQNCGLHGHRWSRSFQQHYNWALGKSGRATSAEIRRREDALRNCRNHRYSGYGYRYGNDYDRSYGGNNRRDYGSNRGRHDRYDYNTLMRYRLEDFARWYADTALAQAKENYRNRCGFDHGKGRWRRDWNDHYRHALKGHRDVSIREVEIRESQLRDCGHRGYRG